MYLFGNMKSYMVIVIKYTVASEAKCLRWIYTQYPQLWCDIAHSGKVYFLYTMPLCCCYVSCFDKHYIPRCSPGYNWLTHCYEESPVVVYTTLGLRPHAVHIFSSGIFPVTICSTLWMKPIMPVHFHFDF